MEVEVDWLSDDRGYSVLHSPKVKNWIDLNNHNLIQLDPFFIDRKTTIRFTSKQWIWPRRYTWDEIYGQGGSIMKTVYDKRVFFNVEGGMGLYNPSIEQHVEFINAVQTVARGRKVWCHNEDIQFLHLKVFKYTNKKTCSSSVLPSI